MQINISKILLLVSIITSYSVGFAQKSKKVSKDTVSISTNYFFPSELKKTATCEYKNLDTNLAGFQLHRPFHRISVYNRDLGNLGTPFFSLLCPSENHMGIGIDWFPLDVLSYITEDMPVYNSKFPLTHLNYANGGNEENLFEVFHTQNIKPNFNAGLDFRVINSKGAYLSQNSNHRNFRIFSHYHTKNNRYQVIADFNYNRQYLAENGGMELEQYNNNEESEVSYSVKLKKAAGDFVKKGVHVLHFLNFSMENRLVYTDTFIVKKDSLSKDTTIEKKAVYIYEHYPNYRVSHEFSLQHKSFSFKDDITSDILYYDTLYNSYQSTFDSSVFVKQSNTFLFHKVANKYASGFWSSVSSYIGVKVDNLRYRDGYLFSDSTFRIEKSFSNQNALIHIGYNKQEMFRFSIDFKYGMFGYNQKNSHLKILMLKEFSNTGIKGKIGYDIGQKRPEYFYYDHSSNAYRWNNPTFGDIKYSTLSAAIDWKGWTVQFFQNFKKDFVYFDTSWKPKQFNDPINSITAVLSKKTTWRWLHFDNSVAYQSINPNPAIDIPMLSVYSSLYAETSIIKKRLRIQPGFDFWYNTDYFSNGYNPAIPSFYAQKLSKTGNYPYVDFFLNVFLKRARAFFKLENILDGMTESKYYEAYNYLMQGRVFRFGISWYLLY